MPSNQEGRAAMEVTSPAAAWPLSSSPHLALLVRLAPHPTADVDDYRPQTFNVVLDTGSSDLWVTDSSCLSSACPTTQFDESASSTIRTSSSGTSINYGSGSVAGDLARDTVTMGNFTVQNQVFRKPLLGFILRSCLTTLAVAADRVTNGLLLDPTSGIMGLGWPAISSTQSTPWWLNLLNQNQLEAPEFSFWLTRTIDDPTARGLTPGGIFTLGGRNTSLFSGDVEFENVVGSTPTYWLLSLSGTFPLSVSQSIH